MKKTYSNHSFYFIFFQNQHQRLRTLVLLCLQLSFFSHAQNTTEVDAFFEEFNASDAPGIAVSVTKNGKPLYQNVFGMANLEYDIPITQQTPFHVASLSKQFTAFLILKLQDEGLLSIEDNVRRFIPELPDYGTPITINHLLTHSSGIRDQWRLLELAGWRLDDVIKTEQVFQLITQQKELNFSPGENFKYSNSGYTLLAIIIERLTKMSFAEYAQESIFEPLNMDNSFFYDDHEEIIKNRAYSYKKLNGRLKKSNLNFATVGPTSLFTTIEDMNKWASNFRNPIIGSEEIFKAMNEKAKKSDGSLSNYAKGQFVRNYKGLNMIYHSGSDAGYRCYFARFPELGYTFALFANGSYINAYDEIKKLINYYLKSHFPVNDQEEEKNTEFKYDEQLFTQLTKEELKIFEGTYFDREEHQFWQVELVNDTLYCKGGVLGEKMALIPIGARAFKIKGTPYDISVNFKENQYHEPILEFRIPDVMWLWLVKEEAVDTSKYLGTYYSEELDASYHLIEQENELFLTHQKLDNIKITPIRKNYFSAKNRNFSTIRFQRNNLNKIEGFSISNGSIERLIFLRK